jgi:hypothetical protein
VRRTDSKTPNGQLFLEKRVFDQRFFFWDVCVDKPTDFKSPPMHRNVRLVEENARECSYTTPDGIPRGRISAGLAVGGVEPDGVLGL